MSHIPRGSPGVDVESIVDIFQATEAPPLNETLVLPFSTIPGHVLVLTYLRKGVIGLKDVYQPFGKINLCFDQGSPVNPDVPFHDIFHKLPL